MPIAAGVVTEVRGGVASIDGEIRGGAKVTWCEEADLTQLLGGRMLPVFTIQLLLSPLANRVKNSDVEALAPPSTTLDSYGSTSDTEVPMAGVAPDSG